MKVKATARSDPKLLAERLAEFSGQHEDLKGQVDAKYASTCDECRLTLINASSVEGWFAPEVAPRGRKLRGILLVPYSFRCRLRDISPEGEFTRD